MSTVRPRPDRKRAEWAAGIIERGRRSGPLPIYGSDEWCNLSPNSPQAVAACVVAAEAHRHHTDPATVRRELELEQIAMRQVAERQDAQDFAELAASVRRSASLPTQAELNVRRGYVVAA